MSSTMPHICNSQAVAGQSVVLATVILLSLAGSAARAEPAFTQHFDGPETAWQLLDTAIDARVLTQACVPGGARNNAGSERIIVAAGNGQSALLQCRVADAAVIEELVVRIWVKADRSGMQLAARVVMPRSRGTDGQRPRTAILRGESYDRPGRWQQLVLKRTPKLLAEQVRIMRSTPGVVIDPREAFIDSVLLVVPGDPQGMEVMTDELTVDGILRPVSANVEQVSFSDSIVAPHASMGENNNQFVADSRRSPDIVDESASGKASPVRLHGATLLVEGKPLLPRVIPWRGEPLQFLAERGFNVIQLERPPSAVQIADATRNALWFVCVPPRPESITEGGLGEQGDRVIGWWLEDEAMDADPGYAGRWAELIREQDRIPGRPIIVTPDGHWTSPSKTADVLLARHERFGQINAIQFDQWLAKRMPDARPGTPFWLPCSSQFDVATGRQASALSGVALPPPSVEAQQFEALVRIGCARGVRGFVFSSFSPLSAADRFTQLRATNLELVNRRLQLIESWLAGGKVTGRVISADADWIGVMLHVDHARLMLPISEQDEPATGSEVAFVVPGVPESCQVFAISPAAMRTLPTQRVTGGSRIVIRPGIDEFVLMTEDPHVIQTVRRRIAQGGAQFARLERNRAVLSLISMTDIVRRLTQLGHQFGATTEILATAKSQIGHIDSMLAAGRNEQALQLARSTNEILARTFSELRRGVVKDTSLQSNPLAIGDECLAEYAAFQNALAARRGSDNLLYGGDFEDLGQMSQYGWRHHRSPIGQIQSRVELAAGGAQHGGYCLELHASAKPATNSAALSGAPVWILSPPIPVNAGQWIEISGWVRIDEPIAGGDEGLQIVDTLGGPDLALAIQQTAGWQPFRMIRAVPDSTELRLTIALGGLGTAQLDALMVRALELPAPRRLPPSPTAADSPKATFTESGPLFIAPQK